ncbi:MAG: hypothetical protein K0R73_1066 [Candidatus Midichloriaceae bacterium]|jgi:ABC-type multidrug transport system ATPase subunit|nr:hypothetical protein [Candidatus Midichloriaceae bacterium]
MKNIDQLHKKVVEHLFDTDHFDELGYKLVYLNNLYENCDDAAELQEELKKLEFEEDISKAVQDSSIDSAVEVELKRQYVGLIADLLELKGGNTTPKVPYNQGITNTVQLSSITEIAEYLTDKQNEDAYYLFCMEDDEASKMFKKSTWVYTALKFLKPDESNKVWTSDEILTELRTDAGFNNSISNRPQRAKELKEFLETLKERNMKSEQNLTASRIDSQGEEINDPESEVKVFDEEVRFLNSTGIKKDLAEAYDINDFLEENNVQALIEYEYASLGGKTVKQAREELEGKLIDIMDTPLTAAWSEENEEAQNKKIKEAIKKAAGKAQFLKVADGLHWACIALLPDSSIPGVIKVVYMNSAYGKGAETYLSCKLTGLDLLFQIIREIEATDELKAEVAQVYLNPTQQLGSNCGVMIAINIAALAHYWNSKAGNNINIAEFSELLISLYPNIMLSSSERITLFTGYVKQRFDNIKELGLNGIPENLEEMGAHFEIKPTYERVSLNLDGIQAIKLDIGGRENTKVKELNTTDSEVERKISSLSPHLISMVFDVIERHRFTTGENIGLPYTEPELTAAYNLVVQMRDRQADEVDKRKLISDNLRENICVKNDPLIIDKGKLLTVAFPTTKSSNFVVITHNNLVTEKELLLEEATNLSKGSVRTVRGAVKSVNTVSAERKARNLIGMPNWEPIPNFAIITGANGLGKTQLLHYIYQALGSYHNQQVFFMEADFKLGDSSIKYFDIPLFHSDEEYSVYIAEIRKALEIKIQKTQKKKEKPIILDFENDFCRKQQLEKPDIFLERLVSSLSHAPGINDTTDAYLKIYIKEFIQRTLDTMKIENPESFLSIVFHAYKKKMLSDPDNFIEKDAPWQEINYTFKKYGFRSYKINMYDELAEHTKLYKWDLTRRDTGEKVEFEDVSSGEQVIISIMAWQYGFDNSKGLNKVKIMLLDEPDKHLDPKFSKIFFDVINEELIKKNDIQVIMTTHRTDTVALAQAGSLFSIKKSGVTPCHKLRALFRLTHNLREITNLHHRIYVEAFGDASFYEGIYQTLTQHCNSTRGNNYSIGDLNPRLRQLLNTASPTLAGNRLLSRRYQLAFYATVATKDAKGGGCKGVENAIKRDTLSLTHIAKTFPQGVGNFKKILVDPELELPFGIIDKDYNYGNINWEERRLRIKRHSLENYLFDPFIMLSIFNEEDIENFSNEAFKEICLECRRYIEEVREEGNPSNEPIEKYFKFLIDKLLENNDLGFRFRLCEILLPHTSKPELFKIAQDGIKIPDYLLKNFLSTFSIPKAEENQYYDLLNKEGAEYKKEEIGHLQLLINVCQHLYPGEEIEASNVTDKLMEQAENIKIIVNNEKTIEISYPKILLFSKGHVIEETVEKLYAKGKADACKNNLLTKISQVNDLMVPLDLAETFFELDAAVRRQMNAVIKADEIETKKEQGAIPLSTYNAPTAHEKFLNLIMEGDEATIEPLCNMHFKRNDKVLKTCITTITNPKDLYAKLGYSIRNFLTCKAVLNFEATKKYLKVELSSSQEAKDLKLFLKTIISGIVGKNNLLIHFRYSSEAANTVYLAGSFNQWLNAKEGAIQNFPIEWRFWKDKKTQVWNIVKKLDKGEHEYKYVINSAEWVVDPNKLMSADGNSYLTI